MIESFSSSGGQKQVNPKEIQKMKQNMQKVPIIQAKSDDFHKKESLKAEIEFEEAQKNIKNTEEIIITEENLEKKDKTTWRENLKNKIQKFINN